MDLPLLSDRHLVGCLGVHRRVCFAVAARLGCDTVTRKKAAMSQVMSQAEWRR